MGGRGRRAAPEEKDIFSKVKDLLVRWFWGRENRGKWERKRADGVNWLTEVQEGDTAGTHPKSLSSSLKPDAAHLWQLPAHLISISHIARTNHMRALTSQQAASSLHLVYFRSPGPLLKKVRLEVNPKSQECQVDICALAEKVLPNLSWTGQLLKKVSAEASLKCEVGSVLDVPWSIKAHSCSFFPSVSTGSVR